MDSLRRHRSPRSHLWRWITYHSIRKDCSRTS